MPAGKSYGVDRKYQELCRDIMVERDSSLVLVPYDGDGIDVPLQLGTSERTFDVALVDQEGRLVVAECRRTKNPVKLYDLDAFAYRVELLRRNSACEVAGVYFAKTGYQEGAVKAAGDSGIQTAVCAQDQEPSSFLLVFHRYDAARASPPPPLREAVAPGRCQRWGDGRRKDHPGGRHGGESRAHCLKAC